MSFMKSVPDSVKTTCPYCGVGCGVLASVDGDDLRVQGDKEHPSNFGRLCSKGSALAETVDLDGRLLNPSIDGRDVTWDVALEKVASGLSQTIEKYGPNAVAFYVSGQLLTEDYYVANKLMKGFIGSANIDTNSRLCMSSAVVGYKRAFGADSVPCSYEDLEQTDLLVLTGSNTAWCHPILFQRIIAAKEQRPNMKVVVIDPRRTSSCDIADLHLPIKPGYDTTLFNGLLSYLSRFEKLNSEYIERYTDGFEQALEAASHYSDIEVIAQDCGLDVSDVECFYQWFAQTEKAITFYSQGVNQSTSGSDKCNSIINVHLATGRVGKVGSGPFSITGQPNAMGGREVGGLANQMAAHMDFANEADRDRVARFWKAQNMATENGLKAVELFDAIEAGKVKAVWIMATNPMVSLPNADRMRELLKSCDLVVVSDCMARTDTTECADILLPATTWGEKEGMVTNSERRISRQRAFRSKPGQARHDWEIVCDVAQRMGFEGFNYDSPAAIFREHAALSSFENHGQRDFDLGGMADMSDSEYQAWVPAQWPISTRGMSTPRLFEEGQFFTANRRAQFVPIHPAPPIHATDDRYPLILNTGRVRDQWHTMTRTGKSPRLSAHILESFVQVHSKDAEGYGLEEGGLAKVTSRWGEVVVRVSITDDQQRGCLFVPIHWSDQFAHRARVGAVVNPVVDPLSGQPEFKHTPVDIKPYPARWYGFVLSHNELDFDRSHYASKARGRQFWRYELAGDEAVNGWLDWIQSVVPRATQDEGDWLYYEDRNTGRFRAGLVVDQRLSLVCFIAPSVDLPSRSWLAQLFAEPELDSVMRRGLLAGRPAQGGFDGGETICSCFGVGENTIIDAIKEQSLCTPEAVGQCLKAGTNCGSCVPELRKLIDAHSHSE
ncbi:nitrate reductase [gamma proteobacterium HTCC5015]|nr:nitrate reductase [gamma proteobacterium HTCC5015]